MNPERIKQLLAADPPEVAGRSPACPDEHLIAGYADGKLDGSARALVEEHAADCDHCIRLIGLLCRERSASGTSTGVPESPAKTGIGTPVSRHAGWRLAPRWAAAAVLVLAVPLLLQLDREPIYGLGDQEGPIPTSTRSVVPVAPGLEVLFPGSGSAVEADQFAVSWTEVPGTPYYDLRIVTDDGDVVVQRRVTGTSWKPSAPLGLEPGEEYFVLVDAYPSGDKAVSSRHVPFRISD